LVGDQYKDYDRPQNVGHFFLALKPDLFVGAAEFRKRMDVLVRRVHESRRAEGFDEVLVPGEPKSRLEARRLAHGIAYRPDDLQPLLELAAGHGLAPLEISPHPY
jgi:LDH2 family malate/lactate/ureidoglycolate dehydrogenase